MAARTQQNSSSSAIRAAGIIWIIAAGLLLDQKLPFWGQIFTDIAVWLIFIALLLRASRPQQISLAACVLYAAGGEIFLSLAWGLYEYRLGNWTWSPHVPWLGLTTLNPPLAAGAFYCVLDLLVTATNVALGRRSTANATRLAAGQP